MHHSSSGSHTEGLYHGGPMLGRISFASKKASMGKVAPAVSTIPPWNEAVQGLHPPYDIPNSDHRRRPWRF
ncbi:hypothetical protein VTI74DRAFT_7982 [Chaetomium olivicolor]